MGAASVTCWVLLLSLMAMSQAKPHYLVYAPDVLVPGQPFNVSVTLIGERNTQSFVRVMIRNSYNKTELEIGRTMDSYSTAVFYMYIPEHLVPDQYNLYVTSDGYVHFDDSTPLQYHVLTISTFVQTDKPLYKPGEIVYFRVFSLNRDFKTVHSPMNISIYDSNGNLLSKWINEVSPSGVVSKNFELSDQPLLGEWSIKVWHKNEISVRRISVEKYVLPRFEVKTEALPYLPNFNMGMFHLLKQSVKVKVTARYTTDKPVRGMASVDISIWSSIDSNKVTQSKEIYGEAEFDIKIADLLAASKDSFVEVSNNKNWVISSLSFNVSVTEDLTGNTIYAPLTRTEIVPAPVEIQFIDTGRSFKGGLPLEQNVFISRRDGRPLQPDDYKLPLEVSITSGNRIFQAKRDNQILPEKTGNEIFQETTYTVPQSGKIVIRFDPPKNSTSLNIDVKYFAIENGVKYKLNDVKYLSPYQTKHGDQLQVKLLTQNVTLGEMVKFRVESTQPMDRLIYTIFAKGLLLSSFQMDAKNQTNFTLSFKSNSTMSPKARFVVSFTTPQNELIIDKADFNVNGIFKQSVSVNFNVPELAPGKEVTLKMSATSGSYVFVGAVDKSVLLLKSPNDITYDLVLGSMDKFTNTFPLRFWSEDSAGSILSRLGLVYMTNLEMVSGSDFPFLQPFQRLGGIPLEDDDGMLFAKTSEAAPPSGSPPSKLPKIRNFFPETWIWQDLQIGLQGYGTIKRVTPGTITKWVTTAFSVHPTEGLSIMDKPVYLRTFQDFYLSLDLPYSIIRNEKFKLRIGIFNYLNTTQQVQVILEDSKYYKVYDGEKELISNYTKFVEVKNNTDIGVDFWLVANVTGTISLRVKALADKASDYVQRNLLVEAEGYTVFYNHPLFVNVTPEDSFVQTFRIPMHRNIVNGSERVELSVIGDVMGPSLNGLGNLVRMPHGCGEQNMINFAPNIYIYGYLKGSRLLTKATEANIIRFTKRGYENELKFRHADGSFSAFGEKDESGSTWLTTFVVKCFEQARKNLPNVPVEESLVKDSLKWLLKQQLSSGRFHEPGKVIHQDMQSGTTKDIPMNAYILITLLETKEYDIDGFDQAMEDLANNLRKWIDSDAPKDSYTLGILLYAMSLLEDEVYFQKIRQEVENLATKEGGMKYWKMKQSGSHFRSSTDEIGNVEIASYVLLAYTQRRMLTDGMQIMKWLLTQRNSMGGYHSTQDTVLSLEALSKFAMLQGWSPQMKVDVTAFSSAGYSYTFPTITRDISTMLISHTFPSDTKNITLTARGNGTALLQVAWQYNLNSSHIKKHLRLNIMDNSTDKDRMAIEACASWKGLQKSGMVLVEIGIPSGFVPETKNLEEFDLIRKTEFEGRNLVIYIEELTQEEFCFDVFANRNYLVLKNQPQPVRVRLYYKPEEELVSFYTLEPLKSLNIHSWDKVAVWRKSGSNSLLTSLAHLVLVILLAAIPLLV